MLIYRLPNSYVQQHAGGEKLSGTWILDNLYGIKLNLYWSTEISTPSNVRTEDPGWTKIHTLGFGLE